MLANFLVCRLLFEILQGFREDDPEFELPDDIGRQIEEMIFVQLRGADPWVFLSFRRGFRYEVARS